MNTQSSPQLSFGGALQLALRVAKLERLAIDIARGPSVSVMGALLVVVTAGAASGLFGGLEGIISAGVMRLVQHVFLVAVVHVLAKFFGENGSFEELFKALGLGSIVQVLGLFPLTGLITTIWYVAILVRVMEQVYGMDTGKAVLIALFPAALVIVGSVMLFFGMITLGALSGL